MARGVPTAAELAAALRAFLDEEVVPGTEGGLSFTARVAANVAAMLERELRLGPAIAVEHRRLLAALGSESDRELVGAIRAGRVDDRIDEVIELIRDDVVSRLSLWNPRYVEPEDRK